MEKMEGISGRPEHIAESSPEYGAFKEAKQESYQRKHAGDAFGESTLFLVGESRETLKRIDDQVAETGETGTLVELRRVHEDSIARDIKFKKKELISLFKEKRNVAGFLSFCREAALLPDAAALLDEKNRFGGKDTEPRIQLAYEFINDTIPDELFEKMLREHVRAFKERQKEFNERELPAILEHFKQRAKELMQNGNLPISEEVLESRMEETVVIMADGVDARFGDISGDYDVQNGVVRTSSLLADESRKKNIFHELIHALAGRTILKRNKKEDIRFDLHHQRGGLAFNTVDKEGDPTGEARFRWLNEAVTENIAMQLSAADTGTYERERNMLQKLYDKGLPRDAVYRAYFENYDPEANKTGTGVPEWKELTKKITDLNPELGAAKILSNTEEIDKLTIEIEALDRELKKDS